MKLLPCAFFFVILLASSSAAAQNSVPLKHEARAVWLATAAGLDWPTTTDVEQQKSSLSAIVHEIRGANFNIILFQVRPRGDAYYQSTYEPWAENLTGTQGKDPGWDPLAFLIAEAHAVGIEVHAWINVFKIYGNHAPPTSALHPLKKFPQWTYEYQGEEWIDPGYPGVRQYTMNVVLDLVRRYDLDGVNFDYMRYPGDDVPDARSYRDYGKGMPRAEWRVQNINDFVSKVYDNVVAIKPWVKVGSSPIGVIGTSLDPSTILTLRKYSQDVPAWLRAGKQDYISPQLYWTLDPSRTNPGFTALIQRWVKWAGDRHVYAGIAAYKPEVMREVLDEVRTARLEGAEGEAYFRYANIAGSQTLKKAYAYPALVPSMPWKYQRQPNPPSVLAVTDLRPGVFQLEWRGSPDASAYVIYRSPSHPPDLNDARSILTFFGGTRTSWIDSIASPTAATYCYALTSVNRGADESQYPASGIGMIRDALQLPSLFPNAFDFEIARADSPSTSRWGVYRILDSAKVRVEMVSKKAQNNGKVIKTLRNEEQKAGLYTVLLPAVEGDSVSVRLEAGATAVERLLR